MAQLFLRHNLFPFAIFFLSTAPSFYCLTRLSFPLFPLLFFSVSVSSFFLNWETWVGFFTENRLEGKTMFHDSLKYNTDKKFQGKNERLSERGEKNMTIYQFLKKLVHCTKERRMRSRKTNVNYFFVNTISVQSAARIQ